MVVDETVFEIEQRRLMVANQLCYRGISDGRVLEVMGRLPRHDFIPAEYRGQAYTDQPVSIGQGMTISQPYIVALMSAELDVEPSHAVLEIGTGSGYQTAILAALAKRVYTIEMLAELSQRAQKQLADLNIGNVEYHVGDGRSGWPADMRFDRILVAAAADQIPGRLLEQLGEGGKMVIPVEMRGGQELLLVEKEGGKYRKQRLCYCRFVTLV